MIKLLLLLFFCNFTSGQKNPQCSLYSDCCGMSNTNCCAKSKCYTTWERVCDDEQIATQEDYQCRNVGRKVCVPIEQKSCRTVLEKVYKSYVVSHCASTPLRVCFNYKRKVCTAKETVSDVEISWQNEKLVLNNASVVRKCFNLQSNECDEVVVPQQVRVPVKKTKVVQSAKDECTYQNTREPDKVIKVPVTSIVNRQVCWNVPRTQCSAYPCSSMAGSLGTSSMSGSLGTSSMAGSLPTSSMAGSLPTSSMAGSMPGSLGTSPMSCPMNQQPCETFNREQRICPLPTSNAGANAYGGSGVVSFSDQQCFNVPGPVCQQSVCTEIGSQQCCTQSMQKMCRNVPNRVTKLMSKVIPGKLGIKKVCNKVPTNHQVAYWDSEIRYNNKTKNNCRPTMKNECINLSIRGYEIQVENVTNTVPVRLPVCEHKEINDEYCHTFPTGNIICRNATVPKSFNLHKIKCDVSRKTTQCAVVPVVDCRSHTTAAPPKKCRLVPRVVCPNTNTCSTGGMCTDCENFRSSNGFSVCSTNGGCKNFNSATSWSNELEANNFLDQFYQNEAGNSWDEQSNWANSQEVFANSQQGNWGNAQDFSQPDYSQGMYSIGPYSTTTAPYYLSGKYK